MRCEGRKENTRKQETMRKISQPIRKALILFFLCIALLSVAHLARWAVESYQSSRTQQQLQQLYHWGGASDSASEQEEQPLVPGSSGLPVSPDHSSGTTGQTMLPEYTALYQQNSNIVGWLNIGNGKLSTPVMQRDNEYYLNHDFYGKEDSHGQVFLDERNSVDFNDDNTILYGHNITSDQSMFHILTRYKDPEFVKENPIIQLNTLYQKYNYAVAAVYIVSTRPEHGELFDYINYLKFSTKAAKDAYIQQVQRRSLIDTQVQLTSEDKLLTLSTCTYEFADARLVVVARRLREGEKAEDFGKNVTLREDPLMPEIWTELFG